MFKFPNITKSCTIEYSRSCVIAGLEILRSLKPQLVPNTESNASVIKKSHNKLNSHVNFLLFFSDFHQNQQVSTNFNRKFIYEILRASVRWESTLTDGRKEGRSDGKTGVTKLIIAFSQLLYESA
jgi:hypothetical protein